MYSLLFSSQSKAPPFNGNWQRLFYVGIMDAKDIGHKLITF
jgi:hypothetical protein